ncbi:MAG TPA: hypothetical protein VEA99_18295 [Gemmatimonadaceae bacterium]|nr:hypothetical protein [Gemmatimonadaceae bacterium]
MPHRTFTDLLGRDWQVWETRPGPRSRVSDLRRDGWITFEALGIPPEKRRMAPIPHGWESMSVESLLLLLSQATPVGRRVRASTSAAGHGAGAAEG